MKWHFRTVPQIIDHILLGRNIIELGHLNGLLSQSLAEFFSGINILRSCMVIHIPR